LEDLAAGKSCSTKARSRRWLRRPTTITLDLLERFNTYVLSEYDDVTVVQADIRNTIAGVIRASRTTSTQPIETQFGRLSGMTADHVFDKAIDIVDAIRYARTGRRAEHLRFTV